MQNTWIWIVVIVVAAVGGFIWWQSTQPADTVVNLTPETQQQIDTNTVPSATTSTDTTDSTSQSDTGAPTSATVTYTADGFSPSTVTIKKGTTVTWNGPGSMWVATGPHPAHTGYDTTSRSAHCAPGYTGATPFDQCTPGTSYSFTFDKAGTFPYHDHMDASNFGKVVVSE
jgi:plastocyanin